MYKYTCEYNNMPKPLTAKAAPVAAGNVYNIYNNDATGIWWNAHQIIIM